MSRFIAFLRSINVGGHTVKMDELRRLFESMGFTGVETFVASGNVIFESAARNTKTLETKIAGNLQQALGYEVATFVRTAHQLAVVASHRLFAGRQDGAGLYVAFLAEPPGTAARAKLISLQTKTDSFHFQGRELYWVCHARFSDSIFSGPLLEKVLGTKATVRNSTTVTKIAIRYGLIPPN